MFHSNSSSSSSSTLYIAAPLQPAGTQLSSLAVKERVNQEGRIEDGISHQSGGFRRRCCGRYLRVSVVSSGRKRDRVGSLGYEKLASEFLGHLLFQCASTAGCATALNQ